MRQLEREAKSLLDSDPSGAFCVLGAIACLSGNEQETRKYHRKSIKLSQGEAHKIFNYAVSLDRLSFFSEALAYAQEAYNKVKNSTFLELVINCAAKQGLNGLAKYMMVEWESLTGEIHPDRDEIEDNLGVVREEVLSMLNRDIESHRELWEKLADI